MKMCFTDGKASMATTCDLITFPKALKIPCSDLGSNETRNIKNPAICIRSVDLFYENQIILNSFIDWSNLKATEQSGVPNSSTFSSPLFSTLHGDAYKCWIVFSRCWPGCQIDFARQLNWCLVWFLTWFSDILWVDPKLTQSLFLLNRSSRLVHLH